MIRKMVLPLSLAVAVFTASSTEARSYGGGGPERPRFSGYSSSRRDEPGMRGERHDPRTCPECQRGGTRGGREEPGDRGGAPSWNGREGGQRGGDDCPQCRGQSGGGSSRFAPRASGGPSRGYRSGTSRGRSGESPRGWERESSRGGGSERARRWDDEGGRPTSRY